MTDETVKCNRCGRANTSHDFKLCDACRKHCREYSRGYRTAHPEYQREYRKAHPEYNREWHFGWYQANRKKVQDYSREYMRGRARVQGSACSYTLDELNALFIEQNGRCFYCGEVLVGTPHIEHMIPISRGGSNYIENIVLSCPPCNLRKYTKTSEEFLQC